MGIVSRHSRKIPVMLFSLVLTIFLIPGAEASEETEIAVTMVGDSVYDLDQENRLFRASVDVMNYDPGDGYYYMQVIQPNTGKIIRESEILMTERGNDMWGAEVAGMIDDEKLVQNGKVVQGDYQVKILTEFGTATASTTFSIIKLSEKTISNVQENNQEQLQVNQTEGIIETADEEAEITETDLTEKINENSEPEKIPEWVKNIALWYGQGTVSEDEFINAIKFLIDQQIIKV